MRQNAQDIDGRPVKLAKRLERNQRSSTMARARAVKSRLVPGLLAFFLLGLAVLVPLLAVREAHAQSDCIILCQPTATPSPQPSPTPTRPKPTATPTATATAQPTAQASVSPSPTIAATEIGQTPVMSSGHTPSTSRQGNGNQPGSGGVLLVSVIAVSVVFVLLLALGGGWLLIRRALIPPVDTKLLPSGARPWSRFRVSNPNSLLPNTSAPNAPEREATLPLPKNVMQTFQEKTLVGSISGGIANNTPLPLVAGDVPGNLKKKKRGLITRAPYYADLAASDDDKINF